MVSIILATVINCVFAVGFSFCIAFCESHKVRFRENKNLTNEIKMQKLYFSNDKYQLLVKEYKELWNNCPNYSGAGIAKYCMAFCLLGFWTSIAVIFIGEKKPIALLSIAIPAFLLLMLLWFIHKQILKFQDWKENGSGQHSICWPIKIFIEEQEKYSYIERIKEIEENLNDTDAVLSYLEDRIYASKRIIPKAYHYDRDWLICSTITATFVFQLSFSLLAK